MVRPAEPPALPTPRKPRSGGLLRLVFVIALVIVAMAATLVVFAPWGFFMGGQFHIMPTWQGWGRMHSNSAGGDYAIYVWFWPDSGRLRGLTYVKGNAMLCTPRGERFNLTLGGNFERPAGLDLNGKTTSFYMYNRTVKHILSGGKARPELDRRGRGSKPDLAPDGPGPHHRNLDDH